MSDSCFCLTFLRHPSTIYKFEFKGFKQNSFEFHSLDNDLENVFKFCKLLTF